MESLKYKIWFKLMDFGHYMGCHQIAERSFFINNYQMPICARCFGVLIGQVIASCFLLLKKKFPLWITLILTAIMGMDWCIQALQIKESTNKRRLITGICGGIGTTFLYIKIIKAIYNALKKFF